VKQRTTNNLGTRCRASKKGSSPTAPRDRDRASAPGIHQSRSRRKSPHDWPSIAELHQQTCLASDGRETSQANQPRLFGLDAELLWGESDDRPTPLAGPTLHPYTRGLVILARSPSMMGVARPTPTPQRAATTAQRASRPSLCMTDSLRAAATHPLVANLARQEIALASVWAALR
jgi:hypothetical protein